MLQAPTGQRINTDSCVFAELVGEGGPPPQRILDIGTGTGVVTLMLALRFPQARITAVECEASVADVAQKNFDQEPWRERIDLRRVRIQDLDAAQCGSFDLVLCNPPYFQNSMPSTNLATAVARHNFDLSPLETYQAMRRLMTPDGSAWLSFPADYTDLWISEGKTLGLHPIHHVVISDHPVAKAHVAVVGWSLTQPASVVASTLFYRTVAQGALSPWMQSFRRKWFPARFNKNIYAVD